MLSAVVNFMFTSPICLQVHVHFLTSRLHQLGALSHQGIASLRGYRVLSPQSCMLALTHYSGMSLDVWLHAGRCLSARPCQAIVMLMDCVVCLWSESVVHVGAYSLLGHEP